MAAQQAPLRTVVLDNGAGLLKIGWSTQAGPRIMPNAVMRVREERRRLFVGDEIEACHDLSGLFYRLPFQRGYLCDWNTEMDIWDYALGKDGIMADPVESALLVTEPPFNFRSIGDTTAEVVFEDFGFAALKRSTVAPLCALKVHSDWKARYPTHKDVANLSAKSAESRQESAFRREAQRGVGNRELQAAIENDTRDRPASVSCWPCCVVVDLGYSFTHITPCIKGRPVHYAIVRIDIGGKALTNYLKETVSYRQLNVMDETYVMNQCKERSCFVSIDPSKDFDLSRQPVPGNTIARKYVLPDFQKVKNGYLVGEEKSGASANDVEEQLASIPQDAQIIVLNNERFTVPEVLFQPSLASIDQCGLPEAIAIAISHCHPDAQMQMWSSIIVVGGGANFANLEARLYSELRAIAPDDTAVAVAVPQDPVTCAWYGGSLEAESEGFLNKKCVTRAEYEEHGLDLCRLRFMLG